MTEPLDRIVVAADGTFAAAIQPRRICVLELPSAAELWEIGTDAAAAAVDAAWVGSPPRLLVLSRFAEWSTVHLLDIRAAGPVGELRLASPARMLACVGNHALVIGDMGAAVLTTGEHLTLHQFPTRTLPAAAGAASNQFVVAMPGVIEEWDPLSRVPKRRLRLPRPTTITALGGSERVVWIATKPDPTRIDVMPLINRGQPKSHELPEPIATVSGHPRSDVLVCVSELGQAYAIDLDGRTRLRTLAFPDIDRVEAAALVMGRTPGVVAGQRGRQFRFVQLDVRDAYMPASTTLPARPLSDPEPVRSSLVDEAPLAVARTPLESPFSLPKLSVASPAAVPEPAGETAPAKTAKNLAARFAAVRERREAALAESGAHAVPTDMPQFAHAVPTDMPPVAHAVPTDMPVAHAVPADMPPRAHAVPGDMPPRTHAVPADMAPAARAVPTDMPPRAHAVPTDIPPVTPPRAHAVPTDMPPVAGMPPPAPEPAASGPLASVLQAAASFAKTFVPAPAAASARKPDIQPRAWRDHCVEWAERVIARQATGPAPAVEIIRDLVARFELSPELVNALALLYGAHLAGHAGVAPVALAHVLDFVAERRWAEALGRGELAVMHVATYESSRVRLAHVVQRILDELPPATGTLVGAPAIIAVLGACVLVQRDASAIELAAHHAARAGGAILIGHDERTSAEVCFEARAIGAVAMLPSSKFDGEVNAPVIYVADDEADAERLGLPRFA